mmetsp:Transcript_14309/g.21046  ORF Transcript_14309/g.21046 Transcript_14309/m.21046 type:complete len:366 (-) Transcript_14309:216-1313(-)|eukprot:CAMPEP_0113946420 /NCGR_PEP_ID=MMETSP1339-20121228/57325_1 /TAXON_ID=94617 /ORGANISM="Fibrocapsa japonica" /LENGTH=365 /DNA_ID=CAMNT_0000952487 /DNA_START=38 /DNA_END=1135 /DNA_ORIENTATION=+ /assembly_acc=CAM_ASM_000762
MASEDKLDALEEALRQKIDTITGFADVEVKERHLEKTFKFFDTDKTGVIEYDEFFAAMVRLNFIGVQREIEALFDRYDDDCSGTIDYKEFSMHLYGLGSHVKMSTTSRSVVERVKARIMELGGANGIRSITRLLVHMDADGSKTLDRHELLEGMLTFGLRDLDDTPGGDIDKLMQYFDRDGNGRISIEEFHRGIRGQMNRGRKKLVREAFMRMDKTGDGYVDINDIMQAYDASHHPEVQTGRMTEEEAVQEMMAIYENGAAAGAGGGDGRIEWHEFLDYYKDLSAGIDDDDYFELMIRNAWHISGGEGWAENSSNRRVLVEHTDGTQEVVEVLDDLGVDYGDLRAVKDRLLAQGIRDIKRISLAD